MISARKMVSNYTFLQLMTTPMMFHPGIWALVQSSHVQNLGSLFTDPSSALTTHIGEDVTHTCGPLTSCSFIKPIRYHSQAVQHVAWAVRVTVLVGLTCVHMYASHKKQCATTRLVPNHCFQSYHHLAMIMTVLDAWEYFYMDKLKWDP